MSQQCHIIVMDSSLYLHLNCYCAFCIFILFVNGCAPCSITEEQGAGGVRQDHVRAVIADSALLSSMEMYAFLLRPGLAALDNLADKFVAGWLLPSKVLDLSYPTPPLPLLVFAIQSDEGRQLAGRSTASRRRYRGQDSILIILEYQSIITVEKLQLWCTNSGCNTRYSKILFTVVVESNAESILQGSLRFFLKPVQLHQQ